MAVARYVWRLWRQKQVSQAGISNYIPRFTVGCNYLSLPEIPASGAKDLVCCVRWLIFTSIVCCCRKADKAVEGLAPIWQQGIRNHHDDEDLSSNVYQVYPKQWRPWCAWQKKMEKLSLLSPNYQYHEWVLCDKKIQWQKIVRSVFKKERSILPFVTI